MELFVSLMNNIGLPYFAVLSISSECFFDLYRGALEAEKSWSDVEPALNEPYYYSYQCAYAYFNYYVVAYVYVCLFSTFGTPLIEQTLLQIHARTAQNLLLHKIIGAILPRILKPVEADPALVPERNVFKPYFDSTQFLVSQFTLLALLLTFGVVFPPLALCLAVTMLATTLYAMLKIGRFLSSAARVQQWQYLALIEAESRDIIEGNILHRAFWMLLVCCFLFMTLFLFDTLGDKVGFQRAYWVLIVVPLLPAVVYTGYALWRTTSTSASSAGDATMDDKQQAGRPEKETDEGGEISMTIFHQVVSPLVPVDSV